MQAKAMADDAQRDLDEALPALEAATASLKNLSRNDVVEVKSLSNPPAGVKLVMEVRLAAVTLLLCSSACKLKTCCHGSLTVSCSSHLGKLQDKSVDLCAFIFPLVIFQALLACLTVTCCHSRNLTPGLFNDVLLGAAC